MKKEELEKIAELVASKLKDNRGEKRDEEFAILLAEKLHEHRSPCHDLDKDEVESLKAIIKKAKRFDRGFFWMMATICYFIVKSIYEYFVTNFHWGATGN